MSAYRLSAPYEQTTLRRRLSGLGLALAINLGLLAILMTLGIIPTPGRKTSDGIVVDMIPRGDNSAQEAKAEPNQPKKAPKQMAAASKPVPKPPPIILPSKPAVSAAPTPWMVEMSSNEMAAGNISNLPHAESGSAGDSEAIGHAPNGDLMYKAEWAREPTNAELNGYLPKNAASGSGLIACKTVANNRVDDCIELGSYPAGSHLASAARQAAWQFHVRPPRKNGKSLIGSWVRIRIDYDIADD